MTAGSVLLTAVLATVALGQQGASTHEQHHGQQAAVAPGMQNGETAEGQGTPALSCQEMMTAHKKAMEGAAQAKARLDDLVKRMDAAQGDAKLAAVSAVIHELVAQRSHVADMMSSMHPKMMGHMMEHIHGAKKGGGGMQNCPMMKHMMGGLRGTAATEAKP